jgi:Fur family ferric uptake transcriptional regulator
MPERVTSDQPEGLEEFLVRMGEFLAEQGLKNTRQRDVIATAVYEAEGHLNVEEIYQRVQEVDDRIGYSTVYRTLRLLRESGLVAERHFGDGGARYEVAHEGEHHDHLICTACGKIVEFEDDQIEARQEELASRHGFTIESHKHEIYGLCTSCQKKR